MLGAAAGDIAGSVYEWDACKAKDFPLFSRGSRFTDDTVLTAAVAQAVLEGRSYREALLDWGNRYPGAGYGGSFRRWLGAADPQPYGSWGNGSAMRASPIGFLCGTEEEVLEQARRSAEVTHNHPEGIKGAQAAALAVWLGRLAFREGRAGGAPGDVQGESKEEIRRELSRRFGYNMERRTEDIRPGYSFDVSCQGSVPEALIAFLDSVSFEDALRNAVSLGGDSDTQACIAGGAAEAFYGGVPEPIRQETLSRLPADIRQVLAG